jgi:radical SAM protein with 4Fe4S-binding SPASM domain
MKTATRMVPTFQRDPRVRLRREAWGGIAFHRGMGDLLELDEEGYALLSAFSQAWTLRALCDYLRRSPRVRMPELARFVRTLEERQFLCSVSPGSPSLPLDPLASACCPEIETGLRAPLVAHWALTYRCNLHCAFCYSESGPHRAAGSDTETRLRLVDRLAAWGVFEVALGGGEPTILPDFPVVLAAIRRAGMVPNVTTNGTIATPAVVQALAEHAGIVHFSADRPELLNAARGPDIFARLHESARLLHRAGVRLGMNLLVTPDNVKDIVRSLQTALDLGMGSVTLLRPKGEWTAQHWPGFPTAADLDRLADGLRAFMANRPPLRLYVDTALRSEWSCLGLFEDPEPEVLGCGGGQRHVAVTPEGEVYACSHLRAPIYRLGHLLHDDPAHLWHSGRGWEARQRYLQSCRGGICACHREETREDLRRMPH